jgi:1-acyl-sn-glycerol-3-phosphate acyltransferase
MTRSVAGYVRMSESENPSISPKPVTKPAPAPSLSMEPVREVPEPLIYSLGRIAARPFSDLWFDLKVYGVHKVPKRGGVLIVSNHQSFLDPMLFACKLPRPLSFFAKSELFENKYFGAFIRSLNAFPVRQGEGDIGAVKEVIRRLHEGHALNVYPEGSRTFNGEIDKMQPGVGLMIRRAQVPVVPAVIDGSFQSWPRGSGQKIFKPHPIRIVFGDPVELHHLKGPHLIERIGNTLNTMLNQLRQRERERNARR